MNVMIGIIYLVFNLGNAAMRFRRSVSIVLALFHDSSSNVDFPAAMPSSRDNISIMCKSSAVALNSLRIVMKSS